MISPWRLAARAAIQAAINSCPPGTSPQKIKEAIDAAYPFVEREYYPYKIWLSERKAYFKILGIPTRKKKEECSSTSPSQLSLHI
ncbi:hypothetical protein PN509_18210 [Nodularia spumigena CS-588/02]|nr:hypothetical protein [Nodularia spumigena CS-588/05]MDB9362222.1 hypothetical protein [Nodularia spumigena CS-588/02]MDB9367191.1 hypothetical protein [Nodularia spumigena CS-588/02A10]